MGSSEVLHGVIAAVGAGLQELVFWYELRARLEAHNYRALRSSAAYWITTVLMIIGSGVGAVIWFYPDSTTLRTYLLTGAAFPLLLKKGVAALGANQPSVLGTRRSFLATYFLQKS